MGRVVGARRQPAAADTPCCAFIVGQVPNARLPCWCEVRRILLAEPLAPVAGHERLASPLVKYGTQVMGEPIRPHGLPLYTDARHYAKAGIPTVLYGAGPHSVLEAHAHGANEHLRLSDLRKATEVVALVLLELLRGAD